jgi:hypothetical protein
MEILMHRKLILFLMTAALASAPALAGDRLQGWGPRVGLASDPDQAIGGVHWNLGVGHDHLRLAPNVQVGFGDDHTILEGTVPVHWMFNQVEADFTPYAGGGLAIAWIDRDLPPNSNADDTEVELALKATGGLEWHLKGRTDFFVELNLVFGDIHDFQAVAGWTFRSKGRTKP